MADLDKLFDGFKKGRMLYPQPRRASEDEFFAELVARLKGFEANGMAMEARITELETDLASRQGDRGAYDRMAAARAAKAAKRDAPAPEAA